jgi:AcrR family transcriptional regulator
MRAEVASVFADLVLDRGYDETTVDDICAAADISRSTFFRYFSSKEDALFGDTAGAGEKLLSALIARPPSETPWIAMRRALDPLVEQYSATDDRSRRLARLIVNTPALAARHREKNARWHSMLRPEIARRLQVDPSDDSDPRSNAVIAAALGCVEAAMVAWTTSEQPRDLSVLLDRAMNAVA